MRGEMGMGIDAVILDFDGVIADTGKDIAGAVNHTLARFGMGALDYGSIIRHVGHGARSLVANCAGVHGKDSLDAMLAVYKEYYLEHYADETTLYPGVAEFLALLAGRGVPAAVVTNKPGDITAKILRKFGILGSFGALVSPESVSRMKPHPEGLLAALGMLGKDPGGALMVGDSAGDIEAGKRAGTSTCGVLYGLGDVGELLRAGPDFTVDAIMSIAGHIFG